MTSADRVSAIVLAGRRDGGIDPLTAAHGVSDKCLVPVLGTACIEHVLAALAEAPQIGRIIVSINDPAILDGLAQADRLRSEGRLNAIRAAGNLADSIIAAAADLTYPLFITTADNVLITPTSIAAIIDGATARQADAAAAFARKQAILAAHPDGQRRFYEFADGGYSNCNSYWIARPEVLSAVEIFRSGGQFAKNPLRIVQAFGLLNLIRFRLGWSSLEAGLERISRRLGMRIVPVVLEDGSYAIDVDNERTHRCASQIMAQRRGLTDEGQQHFSSAGEFVQ